MADLSFPPSKSPIPPFWLTSPNSRFGSMLIQPSLPYFSCLHLIFAFTSVPMFIEADLLGIMCIYYMILASQLLLICYQNDLHLTILSSSSSFGGNLTSALAATYSPGTSAPQSMLAFWARLQANPTPLSSPQLIIVLVRLRTRTIEPVANLNYSSVCVFLH